MEANAFASTLKPHIGGDDTIYADKGGNDWLLGGDGQDAISATLSNDIAEGNTGADVIFGGEGNDFIDPPSNVIIYGEGGNDMLYGGAGDDRLFGVIGDDLLVGDNAQVYTSPEGQQYNTVDGKDLILAENSGDMATLKPERNSPKYKLNRQGSFL